MTRREWLHAAAFAAGVWQIGGVHARARGRSGPQGARKTAGATPVNRRSARDAVDHLLLGAADLDAGIAWFEARTGVKPAVGGVHPGRGTRNALASLGRRQYVEIIAPDPAQKEFNFQIDIRKLDAPRLVNWAVASDDLEKAAAAAVAAKYAVFGPQEGARARPDGSTLLWRTVGVLAPFRDPDVDPMPFFIQWGQGITHPAQDSPAGCRLAGFELRHPDPAALRDALARFDIDAVVTKSDRPQLIAVLETPKGRVTV